MTDCPDGDQCRNWTTQVNLCPNSLCPLREEIIMKQAHKKVAGECRLCGGQNGQHAPWCGRG